MHEFQCTGLYLRYLRLHDLWHQAGKEWRNRWFLPGHLYRNKRSQLVYRVFGSGLGAVPAQRYQPAGLAQSCNSELRRAADAAENQDISAPDTSDQGDPPGTVLPPLPEREQWDRQQEEAKLESQQWAADFWEVLNQQELAPGSFAPAQKEQAPGSFAPAQKEQQRKRSSSSSSSSSDSNNSNSSTDSSSSEAKKTAPVKPPLQRPPKPQGEATMEKKEQVTPQSSEAKLQGDAPQSSPMKKKEQVTPRSSKATASASGAGEGRAEADLLESASPPTGTKLPRFWQPAPQPPSFLVMHCWQDWSALPTKARSPFGVAARAGHWEAASAGISLEIVSEPRSPPQHAALEGFVGLTDKDLAAMASNDFSLKTAGCLVMLHFCLSIIFFESKITSRLTQT